MCAIRDEEARNRGKLGDDKELGRICLIERITSSSYDFDPRPTDQRSV
jgi:hypothetical protein